MKEEFTTERWEKALVAVFVKSISDPGYRRLCLADPRAAVALVAPNLELPRDFHFKFAAQQKEMIYSYLLPPLLEDCTTTLEYAKVIIEQDVTGKTHPPTNTSGTGTNPDDPKGGNDSGGHGDN